VKSPCQNLNAKDILGEGPGSRDRILSDDEIFAFWRATGRMLYPVGPAYRLLILTALRLREAVDAQRSEFDPLISRRLDNRKEGEQPSWRDLPEDRSIWTIPKERMKGKKSGKKQARAHVVPMTDEIMSLFASRPRLKGRFVFSTTNGRVPVSIGTKIKKELDARMLLTLRAMARRRGEDSREVKLPHWVNHDLRRTARSHLSRLKIEEVARESVLAHARPGIKGTYDLHDYREEKREALQMWAARVRTIVEPTPSNVITLRDAG
jgi:integrase